MRRMTSSHVTARRTRHFFPPKPIVCSSHCVYENQSPLLRGTDRFFPVLRLQQCTLLHAEVAISSQKAISRELLWRKLFTKFIFFVTCNTPILPGKPIVVLSHFVHIIIDIIILSRGTRHFFSAKMASSHLRNNGCWSEADVGGSVRRSSVFVRLVGRAETRRRRMINF